MIEPILIFFIISIEVSICAIAISCILMDADMILSKYNQWLDKFPDWISKPLGKCETCLSGQLALWSGLAWCIYCSDNPLLFLALIPFILTTIFFTKLIHKNFFY